MDKNKIKSNNDKVSAAIKKWPLPIGERDGLLAWVAKCTDAMIALTYKEPAVSINNDGRFVATFALASWALGDRVSDQTASQTMVNKAASLIGSHKKWQKGPSNNLSFKSMNSYAIFRNIGPLSVPDKSKIKLPANSCQVHEKCAAAGMKKIKENKKNEANELRGDIFSTTVAASEGIFEVLSKNTKDLDKNFAKGARIVNAKFKTVDVLYTSGKIILQGNGKINEKVVVGELSSLLVGWGASAVLNKLVIAGAPIALGVVGVALSVPAIAAVAAAVGATFALMYIWFDWDQWVAENAPLWWEKIKEGTLLAYLESTKAITKLKTLIAEWKDKVIDSMTEFLFPQFENAYADYIEAYATASMSESMDYKDWINPWINKFLKAAGVPDFSKK